jgi:hypothetical protein
MQVFFWVQRNYQQCLISQVSLTSKETGSCDTATALSNTSLRRREVLEARIHPSQELKGKETI